MEKKKADEFAALLLKARSVAHAAHWRTRKYSAHIALGDFYGAIGDLADTFVEQYQGYYNRLLNVMVESAITTKDVTNVLDEQVEWIERYRYEICSKEETALQNVIDEIVGLYQSTLYKLRFLTE